jgi:purine-binding chemotaxis protein CheW
LASSESSTLVSILPFELERHRFGVLVADVQEVLRAATASPLPKAPAVILGVFNLRGSLVPVFDIRSRFGFPRRRLRHTDTFIIVKVRGRPAAIVADQVVALVSVSNENIERCKLVTADAAYVAGVAKLEDGNIIIYDLAGFLTDTERADLDEALTQVSA